MIMLLANRLVQLYRSENGPDWKWFEGYLTYANSVLPEAMLCAYEATGNAIYREIAKRSFDFLLSHTFTAEGSIRVISNRGWMLRGEPRQYYGEQPIDVAYTVVALSRFYRVCGEEKYLRHLESAFSWFLGNNHLGRMIYNPCTGGSSDGLEEDHVNLNQGAESTVSYLMARLTIEQHKDALREMNALESARYRKSALSLEQTELRKKELTAEFAAITRQMEEFPELYLSLSETPLFISNHEEETSIGKFEDYLSFLREQLQKHTTSSEIGKVS
jgi:uncharacterized protein YyaL (SSP411 family)